MSRVGSILISTLFKIKLIFLVEIGLKRKQDTIVILPVLTINGIFVF